MRVDEVRSVVRVAASGRVAVTSSASPVSLLVWRPMLEVSPVATIAEAAARMAADGVSALGVATAAGAAIVTEHDISRAVAAGVDPGLTPVETIAMPNPITVDGSTPIVTAASTMLNAHVRHLLVRTDAGFTIGVEPSTVIGFGMAIV